MGAYDTVIGKIGYQIYFNGRDALMGMHRMEGSFNRLKKVVTAVVAGKLVKDAANFGREISLMSLRTGESISNLSRLRSSFIAAGAGAQGFQKVIGSINDGLLGLSMGQGDFGAKLGMLGISPYTNSGRLKTEKEVLKSLADWAKRQKQSGIMTDQDILYRFRTLFQIPDEVGQMLLRGGAAYEAQITKNADKVGEITAEESIKLKELDSSLKQFGDALDISIKKLTAFASPALEKVIDVLTGVAKKAGENPEKTLTAIAGGTIAASAAGFKALADVGGATGMGGKAMAAGVGGLKTTAAFGIGALEALVLADVAETYSDLYKTGGSDSYTWKLWENYDKLRKEVSESFGIPEWLVRGISNLSNPLGSVMDMGGEIADLVNLASSPFSVSGDYNPTVNQNIEMNINGSVTSETVSEIGERVEYVTGEAVKTAAKQIQ